MSASKENLNPVPDRVVEGELDQELLARLHAGDSAAATEIYVRYSQRLIGLMKRRIPGDLQTRLDPEDIVQSVFRSFFRRAAAGAYDVPEGSELWRLFLVMALNKVRKVGAFHRSAKRDVRRTAEMPLPTDIGPEAFDENSLRVLEMTIDEVLERSPAHLREMVILRVKGCEVGEIAAKTGKAKRTVERCLQNFRQEMWKRLRPDAALEEG